MHPFDCHPSLRSAARTLPAVAIAVLLALPLVGCTRHGDCPDAGNSHEQERFRFFRTPQSLIRLDSASGQVWSATLDAEGGWTPIGEAPSEGGEPAHAGRYILQMVGNPKTLAIRAIKQRELVRFDRSTGRAWLGSARAGSGWTRIDEAEQTGNRPAPEPRAEAASAPDTGEGHPAGEPQPQEFRVIPRGKFSSENEEQDIAVVMQAMHKEGLPTSVRVWAVRQLGEFDPDLAVPRLLDALHSEEPEVVVAAIETLGKTKAVSTIPQIMRLRTHTDARVRGAVERVVVGMK